MTIVKAVISAPTDNSYNSDMHPIDILDLNDVCEEVLSKMIELRLCGKVCSSLRWTECATLQGLLC